MFVKNGAYMRSNVLMKSGFYKHFPFLVPTVRRPWPWETGYRKNALAGGMDGEQKDRERAFESILPFLYCWD